MVLSMERFQGKVAVVTGASAGIGADVAEELVNNGVIVAGLARRTEPIENLVNKLRNKKGKLYAFKCDMTKEEDIKAAIKKVIEELGPIHILVNNAGLMKETTLINGDTQAWKITLDTNVLGLCIATREVVQNMKANNTEGHIIHMNSMAGHAIYDFPGINVYAATKYAVTNLAGTLKNELKHEKLRIKVTSISPGLVKTEATEHLLKELNMPILYGSDVADAVIYALSTPAHVNVNELIVEGI